MTIDPDEAAGRMRIAVGAYANWRTEHLWEEFTLLTDEAADDDRAAARRESIGLALIGRGATVEQLGRPWEHGTS